MTASVAHATPIVGVNHPGSQISKDAWNEDHDIVFALTDASDAQQGIAELGVKGADIASAATLVPGTDGDYFHVTGATGPITAITPSPAWAAGRVVILKFDSTPTVTYNATSLILQGAVNFVAAAGDILALVSEGSGNWREVWRRLAAAALAFDATVPAAVGTAAAGSAATVPHRDHVHPTGAGTPTTAAAGDAAAVGTGPAAAMTDHRHGMPASFGTTVVLTYAESTTQFSTSSSTFVDITGMSLSVTTSNASNPVEFQMTGAVQCSNGTAGVYLIVNTSDSVNIDQKSVAHAAGGGDVNCLLCYRKTTSPASAKTVKGQLKIAGGATAYIGTGSPDYFTIIAREYR